MHVEVSESSAKGVGVRGRKGEGPEEAAAASTLRLPYNVISFRRRCQRATAAATVGTDIACCTHTTHRESGTYYVARIVVTPLWTDIVPLKSAFGPRTRLHFLFAAAAQSALVRLAGVICFNLARTQNSNSAWMDVDVDVDVDMDVDVPALPAFWR